MGNKKNCVGSTCSCVLGIMGLHIVHKDSSAAVKALFKERAKTMYNRHVTYLEYTSSMVYKFCPKCGGKNV